MTLPGGTTQNDIQAENVHVAAQLIEGTSIMQPTLRPAQLHRKSGRMKILEEVVRHLKSKRCTPGSEKNNPDQFLLFDEAKLVTDPALEALYEKENQNKLAKPSGRKPFSSNLPRQQIFLYLSNKETALSHINKLYRIMLFNCYKRRASDLPLKNTRKSD